MAQSSLRALGERSRRAIVRLNKMRAKHELSFDEALILLAAAERNFSGDNQMPLAPASVMSIAEFTQTPYETTRRRIGALAERGLLARIRDDGYVVSNLTVVRDLIDIVGEPPMNDD